MANSMVHWNGNQLCAIDCETTGLDPHYHELIQICILPLDSNVQPRKDILPFYIELVPDYPERASFEAMKVNRLNFAKIGQRGHDRLQAVDMLEEWIKKLKLPTTKYGNSKRIIPLGQNYTFDQSFIQAWLGVTTYNDLFSYQYRDTQRAALYLNDRAGMHAEDVPFAITDLDFLARRSGVESVRAHDALSDCVTTAGIYRYMLQRGLLG